MFATNADSARSHAWDGEVLVQKMEALQKRAAEKLQKKAAEMQKMTGATSAGWGLFAATSEHMWTPATQDPKRPTQVRFMRNCPSSLLLVQMYLLPWYLRQEPVSNRMPSPFLQDPEPVLLGRRNTETQTFRRSLQVMEQSTNHKDCPET